MIPIVRTVTMVVVCASTLTAQAAPTPPNRGVLINGRDIGLFAGATAATALLSRVDVRIARTLGDSGFHVRHPGWTTAAKRTSLVTETVLMLTGSAVWGVARL
ncbi:MAG TPA: hypothetical protein VGQ56_16880, partial [Gemmatimonadaceae bacterium]|nr:hypothetical protein [Gemmatimonadaceae bacterium]